MDGYFAEKCLMHPVTFEIDHRYGNRNFQSTIFAGKGEWL